MALTGHIVLKNYVLPPKSHCVKKTGLIENSTIDERNAVDGLKTPQIAF